MAAPGTSYEHLLTYAQRLADVAAALPPVRALDWNGHWGECVSALHALDGEHGGHEAGVATVLLYVAEVAIVRALSTELEADMTAATAAIAAATARIAARRSLVERGGLLSSLKSLFGSRPPAEPDFVARVRALVGVELDLCESALAALESAVLFKDGHWLRGAYLVRRAWKHAEKCLGVLPTHAASNEPVLVALADGARAIDLSFLRGMLQLEIGFFRFMFGRAPPSMSWLLSIAGCPGDCEAGLAELRRCAAGGTVESITGRYASSLIDVFMGDGEADRARGLSVCQALAAEFPESPLLQMGCGLALRECGQLDAALVAFEAVTRSPGAAQLATNGSRDLGVTLLGLGRFAEAAAALEHFLTHTSAQVWLPWTSYQLAVAYSALGDGARVRDTMARLATYAFPKQREFAAYAAWRAVCYAERLASAGPGPGPGASAGDAHAPAALLLSEDELTFACAYFANHCSAYDHGLALLAPRMAARVDATALDAARADAWLGEGYLFVCMLLELGRRDEARACADLLLGAPAREAREARWVLPFLCAELAQAGPPDEAADWLARAAAFSHDSLPFARAAQFRIQRAKTAVERARRAAQAASATAAAATATAE